ncbi:putative efflux protein, MATE family [Desulfosporosinus orientis DSM 765]|uniref:Multidrug export protein MepA n=1 Tax=Desulfosporosinus orientis (strain ATCC 19365 / DSM 765 / NCIMB 8382 / VKM B-1628 / Singapore I) TaxID=768706 RepID=G7WIF4_DESOD|nr:MATE family efflux transporter [Desulfosporosinus orientis]AET68602.1 putative efflux protein, MATE family [Desulfosporosinus orientis DSM 765]
MNKNLEMRDEKISKLLWKFSLPAIIAMLVNALYNIVDRIFVGRSVGFVGIAATTVAFPIMIIMMATSMLIAIGATALISIRLGEQKKEDAEKIAGNATVLLILLPLLLAALYLAFTDPVLMLFGADQTVLPYARDFTHIIMLGSVSGSIAFGMNNFIRAEGNPRYAMLTQIIGAVINTILNYIFIFKLGLGIKGSALASISGQTISAMFVLGYYLSGRSIIKIHLKNLKLQMPVVLRILSIGFAPFAMQIANSVQQTILNKTLMVYGGDLALSAVGIIMSIATLIFMPIVGISQGAQPLIGFNYGAKQYERVKETLMKSVFVSTIMAVIGFIVIRIWPNQIVGLFSKGDLSLTELTVHAMLTFFTLLPLIGIQILCSSYFQAVGKPVQSTLLSLSRQVLLFIPLLIILPRFWGIEGVWRTAPIADALSVLITVTVILFEMRTLPKSTSKPVIQS